MKQKRVNKDTSFLLKKSGIALTVKAGGMITQYLFIFTVARLLGPGKLGTFTLSFTVVQLVAILALLGLDNLIIRKVAAAKAANNPASLKQSFQTAATITGFSSIILSILLYVSGDFLATNIFHKPGLAEHLRVISFALPPFVWINLHAAAFRGSKNMIGFTLFKTAIPLINTLLILISWYGALSITPTLGFTVAVIIVCILYIFSWRKFSDLGNIEKVTSFPWKETIKESLPMMITGSIFFILNWIDNLFIGFFRTEADVGIYDTAFKIASASAIILQAVNAIQAPVFAEFNAGGDIRKLRQSVFHSNRLLFISTLPITVIMLLMPGFLLSFFGEEFKVGALCLSILSVSNMLSAICGSVGILLQMTGHQIVYNRIILIAAFLSVILNILLIPKFGIVGAAIASSVAKVFQNIASAIIVYKRLGIFSIYIPWVTQRIHSSVNNKS